MGERQLTVLSRPFPARLVHQNPSGGGRGDYVSHSAVTEKLLAVCGGYSYEVVDVFRGKVKGKDELGDVVVGVLGHLTVRVDGQVYDITEVGDCENPSNWPHDGARLKDASSDAIKRCAMRLGVGLHLWSQQEFFLHDYLTKQDNSDSQPS